jgi:glutathione S-transferase
VLQWQFFEQYSHEPYVAVARFWKTYSDRPEVFEKQRERLLTGGYAALDALERRLDGRAFLVGERYSLADISLYAYTHVADEGGFELGRYPAIRAWLDRVTVRADDGTTRVVALEELRQEVEAAGDALGGPKGPPRG